VRKEGGRIQQDERKGVGNEGERLTEIHCKEREKEKNEEIRNSSSYLHAQVRNEKQFQGPKKGRRRKRREQLYE